MVSKIHASMIAALEEAVTAKIAEISGGKVDIGDLVISAADAKPKFLLCDGGAYSRTTYAALFEKIGTKFGAGNGTTTFNVPDPRGRSLIAAGSGSGLTTRAVGDKGGEETHKLTVAEMPAHNHTGSASGAAAHAHSIPLGTGFPEAGAGSYAMGAATASGAISTGSAGAYTPTVTINNNGSDTAHNNMPPFLTIGNLFIYAGV